MPIKVKSLAGGPGTRQLSKAYENYFNVADLKKIREIRRDIFFFRKPFLERDKAYLRHKRTISTLKPLYKDLIEARNKYAKSRGPYRNFLEFSLVENGVSRERIKKFLEKIDPLLNMINGSLPKPRNKIEFYSSLNMPDFIDEVSGKKYPLPDYVIKRIRKLSPELEQALPKIKFEDVDKTYGFNEAVFQPAAKTVVVRTWQNFDLQHAISLAHEIGHAMAYIRLAKEGLESKDRSKYWHEKQAIKTELAFIKTLPQKLRNAAVGDILWQLTIALFEVETYTRPNLDFDQMFAQAFNRCYRDAIQKENPFYVVMPLIERPCSAVLQGIVHAEELSRTLA